MSYSLAYLADSPALERQFETPEITAETEITESQFAKSEDKTATNKRSDSITMHGNKPSIRIPSITLKMSDTATEYREERNFAKLLVLNRNHELSKQLLELYFDKLCKQNSNYITVLLNAIRDVKPNDSSDLLQSLVNRFDFEEFKRLSKPRPYHTNDSDLYHLLVKNDDNDNDNNDLELEFFKLLLNKFSPEEYLEAFTVKATDGSSFLNQVRRGSNLFNEAKHRSVQKLVTETIEKKFDKEQRQELLKKDDEAKKMKEGSNLNNSPSLFKNPPNDRGKKEAQAIKDPKNKFSREQYLKDDEFKEQINKALTDNNLEQLKEILEANLKEDKESRASLPLFEIPSISLRLSKAKRKDILSLIFDGHDKASLIEASDGESNYLFYISLTEFFKDFDVGARDYYYLKNFFLEKGEEDLVTLFESIARKSLRVASTAKLVDLLKKDSFVDCKGLVSELIIQTIAPSPYKKQVAKTLKYLAQNDSFKNLIQISKGGEPKFVFEDLEGGRIALGPELKAFVRVLEMYFKVGVDQKAMLTNKPREHSWESWYKKMNAYSAGDLHAVKDTVRDILKYYIFPRLIFNINPGLRKLVPADTMINFEEDTRTQFAEKLFAGKSIERVLGLSKAWHLEKNRIVHNIAEPSKIEWKPISEEFQASNGLLLHPISSTNELILEAEALNNCMRDYDTDCVAGNMQIFVIKDKDQKTISAFCLEKDAENEIKIPNFSGSVGWSQHEGETDSEPPPAATVALEDFKRAVEEGRLDLDLSMLNYYTKPDDDAEVDRVKLQNQHLSANKFIGYNELTQSNFSEKLQRVFKRRFKPFSDWLRSVKLRLEKEHGKTKGHTPVNLKQVKVNLLATLSFALDLRKNLSTLPKQLKEPINKMITRLDKLKSELESAETIDLNLIAKIETQFKSLKEDLGGLDDINIEGLDLNLFRKFFEAEYLDNINLQFRDPRLKSVNFDNMEQELKELKKQAEQRRGPARYKYRREVSLIPKLSKGQLNPLLDKIDEDIFKKTLSKRAFCALVDFN